jgi:hypothetical protein
MVAQMRYLNLKRLDELNADQFRSRKPYPWVNPAGLLTDAGYQTLYDTLPDLSQFSASFGVTRAHGQRPHDRYVLEYAERVELADSWRAFIRELESPEYHRFLQRMFGRRALRINMHWHYAPAGSSVSPHCDARHKLGSHIFYFSNPGDWRPEWGGETLLLDDGGRFKRSSAPGFDDFDHVAATESIGNRSLLFARSGNSWHGVREIHCPEGAMRKVFIVVINDPLRTTVRNAINLITRRHRAGGHREVGRPR